MSLSSPGPAEVGNRACYGDNSVVRTRSAALLRSVIPETAQRQPSAVDLLVGDLQRAPRSGRCAATQLADRSSGLICPFGLGVMWNTPT